MLHRVPDSGRSSGILLVLTRGGIGIVSGEAQVINNKDGRPCNRRQISVEEYGDGGGLPGKVFLRHSIISCARHSVPKRPGAQQGPKDELPRPRTGRDGGKCPVPICKI